MDNQQNNDSRVKLYLRTLKPLIYAGQYLQATAHVQVLEDTQYKSINISFVGKEKVQWQETNEKQTKKHQNQIETYSEERVLSFFDKGLQKGHYQFPFNILLPSAFPASMKFDENNYIAYILTVFLPEQKNQGKTQSFSLSLQIRQPLRQIFNVVTEGTVQSKGCGCFGSKQSALFRISTDRNQIHYTDKFKVRAEIDNKTGGFAFDQIGLLLTKKITRVSSNGVIHQFDQDMGVFYKSQKVVNVGRKKKFQIELHLPARIVQHTAIGNIISRSYFVCLMGEGSCFQSSSRMYKHMILNNQVPPPAQQSQVKKPQNWNPQIKSPSFFVNFKPYLFNPASGIKLTNQKGEVVSSTIYQQPSAKSLFRIQ